MEFRAVHPLAWWVWAMGAAIASTRTTNPLVLLLLGGAVATVVFACRDSSPWARVFPVYLGLGLAIILFRVVFHVLVGLKTSDTVVLDLPHVTLPDWAVGVTILGPVGLEGLLTAAAGGLQLAVLVICFGAANALANPRRVLRHLPAALHHLATAVVIAVTVTPQLATALVRVRRAQRLRGADPRGPRAWLARALPVLQDATDDALALAASMDSRGYGRTAEGHRSRFVTAALLVALAAGVVGSYGLLDATSPDWLGAPVLLAGGAIGFGAGVAAGRRVPRTRYRPEQWGALETMLAVSGAAVATLIVIAARRDPAALWPSLETWPTLPLSTLLAAAMAAVPVLGRVFRAGGALP